MVGGTFLLFIPGLIFSVWFGFAVYETIMDAKKPMDAMRASKDLVVGRWMAVAWRFIAPGAVFALLVFAVEGSFNILFEWILTSMSSGAQSFELGATIFFALVTSAVSLLLTPLTTAAPIILYLELKKAPRTQAKKA